MSLHVRVRLVPSRCAFLALLTLTGCASSPNEDTAQDDVVRGVPFKGSGPEKAVTIGEHEAQLVPTSGEVSRLVGEMTSANDIQNNQFLAAVYRWNAAAVADFTSAREAYGAQKRMAFDLMYRADGSSPGGEEGFGWADHFRPDYEDMACRRIALDRADATFKRFGAYVSHQGDEQIPTDKRALIERDATKLVASFLKDLTPSAAVYTCAWDNNDDTASEALVSVDGFETRVVVGWEGG
jgi:hypothetical protein